MKKATLKDIAQKTSLSTSSISMILNGQSLSRFSEAAIESVYSACRELNYIPKNQRRYKNPKKIIVIICPSMMNPYYATLTQSMEQEARLQGYMTLLFTTYWDKTSEQEILELVENPNIAGVIFSMIPQQPKLAEAVSQRVPMVAVGDQNIALKIDTVDINNYQAGRILAKHLISLGHKHIAYLSTTLSNEHSSRVRRCQGLQDEYAHSCPDGTVTIISQDASSPYVLYVTDIEHETGYSLGTQCLKEAPHVTAIVAINDMVCYGVRHALLDAGKKIPEDISLCAFDNIYPSNFHGIELTTIELHIAERGRSSIKMLLKKLKGETSSSESYAFTRLEYQSFLVEGKTTGPVHKD